MNCINLVIRRPLKRIFRPLAGLLCAAAADSTALGQIVAYPRSADLWVADVDNAEGHSFDEFYQGFQPGLGCLASGVQTLPLAGGVVTVTSFDPSGALICTIQDGSSFGNVSDAWIEGSGGTLVMEFSPPITAFYGLFGSVAVGSTVTQSLYYQGSLIATTTSLPSVAAAEAQGHGFVSAVSIDRIEFTSTDLTPAVLGAFRFLVPGEPSLGTVHIPGYVEPGGTSDINLDFACVFARDTDADGLYDHDELYLYGTDPYDADSDNDGLLDGTEIDIGTNPLNPDSDGDGLPDGYEVSTSGTDPLDADTDGDGLSDFVDPTPLQPGASGEWLEEHTRNLGDAIASLDLSLFNGPNNNANKGRRNSLANRVRNAAKAISHDDYGDAVDLLYGVLDKLDSNECEPDWLHPTPTQQDVADELDLLIALLIYG